jgi:hypothetical protein
MKQVDLPIRFAKAILLVFVLLGFCRYTWAVPNIWQGPNLGDWNTGSNWSIGFPPDACCDEIATVNNNTTALIAGLVPNANGMVLGTAVADIGGVRIASGGSLTTTAFSGGANGALTIGQAGQGNLAILGGGSLSGTSLSLGGVAGSSILLGDASGLTATLTTSGAATLNRTTDVTGRFVNFSAGGNLTFGGSSTLIGHINHTSLHSALKSAGAANLNGTFKVDFTGVTPTVGNTWDIIDATTINGNFSALDASAAPALPAGQAYAFKRSTGGTNGQLLQLTVEQLLTLRVHRATGAVSIINAGSQPVTIDGYSILSSRGALTGTWNSLQDQTVPNWVETAVTNEDLSELHPQAGGLAITNATPRSLGSPYEVVFPAFGTHPDHLQFEYSTPDGQKRFGAVEYQGTEIHNNFVLNVNPATGQAAFRNDSSFNVAIDGYTIYSTSGSLTPATWNSLQDQGVADWEQAPPAPSATVVSELKADGETMFQEQTGFSLGQLFKTVGATQDLIFEFILEGEDLPRIGTVVYGAFTPPTPPIQGIPGDFNNDGSVDAADYVVWRKTGNLPADYNLWRTNFGRTSGAGSGASGPGAVPEPGTVGTLIFAAVAAIGIRRRPPVLPRHLLFSVAAMVVGIVVFAGKAETALAQELYFEGFDDATLGADTTTNFATIANGIASFDDQSATTRGRFVVRRAAETAFNAPVMTFSFETAGVVTAGAGGNELRFRAGIGTANNTLQSAEFVVEAALFNNGNQGAFQNNGNETMFLIANNQNAPLTFASPIDGSTVMLNAFQYVPYIKDNSTGVFGLIKPIGNFTDPTPAVPGFDDIVRFGIGSSSNAHTGTFAIDDVRVFAGVSFGEPACIPGDTNCDDVVDIESDFEAIRANFRRSPRTRLQGDLTGDNTVNFDDFVQWKGAFLGGGGSLAGVDFSFSDASVPEPASITGLMVAMFTVICCSRRRRRR